jgi:hypothetical protein
MQPSQAGATCGFTTSLLVRSGDKGAACADGVDESFFGEDLDGPADGSACYPVLLLQVALAGQLVGDLAGSDLVAQDRGELLIQRCGIALINRHPASVGNMQVRMDLRYRLVVLFV